jgi:3-dehydroquinate synthase
MGLKKINTGKYMIEIGSIVESGFGQLLRSNESSKKVIIVDENTHQYCLSALLTNFDLSNAEIIQIPVGEDSKQIEIVASVWQALTEYEIGRNDLVINLGGGVVTDFGGFMSSCYKRGVRFINIPTSLLAMVDASIGGKTGVNLGELKNQIGVFSDPIAVFIDPGFLATLPHQEKLSGFAEMMKHGLIQDAVHFENVLKELAQEGSDLERLIQESVLIKKNIVDKDPLEAGERKLLNFGHSVGHVLEGLNYHDERFTHGYCVAIGMIVETVISYRLDLVSSEEKEYIISSLSTHYPIPGLSVHDIATMLSMLRNDKKNREGKLLFTLIEKIGKGIHDVEVSDKLVEKVLGDLQSLAS